MVLPEDLKLGQTVWYGKDRVRGVVDGISWDFVGLWLDDGRYVMARGKDMYYGEEEESGR